MKYNHLQEFIEVFLGNETRHVGGNISNKREKGLAYYILDRLILQYTY